MLKLSLCAMGWFLSITVLIFVWLFASFPFSRKGRSICRGLNMTQAEHVSKTTCIVFVENSHTHKAQKAGFLLNVTILFHRVTKEMWKKGRKLRAAEASYILLCYFAMPETGSWPTLGRWSRLRKSNRQDDFHRSWPCRWCSKLEEHQKYLNAGCPGEVISSPHLISGVENNYMQVRQCFYKACNSALTWRSHCSATTASILRLSCNTCPTALSCIDVA